MATRKLEVKRPPMKEIMTLQEAVEQDDRAPLWVLNSAESSEKVEYMGGDVFISVKTGDDMVPVNVRHTWLPTEMSEYAPRSAILKSRSFMDAVRNKLIEIITTEFADHLNQRAGAKEERDRLAAMDRKVKEFLDETRKRTKSDNTKGIDTAGLADLGDDVDDKFKAKVVALNNMSSADAQLQIRLMNKKIRISQVEYLIEHLKHRAIANWFQTQLDKA